MIKVEPEHAREGLKYFMENNWSATNAYTYSNKPQRKELFYKTISPLICILLLLEKNEIRF
jgi:hypothetical protein